jgi:hypothetical protein
MLTGFDEAMGTSLGNIDTMADQANAAIDGINTILPALEAVPESLAEVQTAVATVASNASLSSSAASVATAKALEATEAAATAGSARIGAEAARDIALAAAADVRGIQPSIGTAKGDLIGFSAAGTPVRVAAGADGQTLKADSTAVPGLVWGDVESAGGGTPTQITNALWGVCSGCTLENVGTAVTVTNITSGVCTTTNTQGLAVGRLVKFSAGSNAAVASKVFEVTALVANTSFALNDTSINPGAAASSCYEVTQGFVAADTKAPDLWDKVSGVIAYIEHSIVPVGFGRSLKVVGSASVSTVQWSDGGRKTQPAFYTRYQGKTRAIGCPVFCSTPNAARIFIQDSDGISYSGYHPGDGQWHWLEVTRACAATITSYQEGVDSGLSTTAYFGPMQSQQGAVIGDGNFVPIVGELIQFDIPIISTKFPTWTGRSAQAFTPISAEVDSKGVIPSNAKRILLQAVFYDTVVGRVAAFNALGPSGGSVAAYDPSPTQGKMVVTQNTSTGVSGHFGVNLSAGLFYVGFMSSGTNTAYLQFSYTGVQL